MEYAFAHTNPTSMPQNKAAIIIREYQGGTVDWGILTGEGVCATLGSFESSKRFLPVLAHYLTVLYPPPSTSPRRDPTSLTPPPRRQRQKNLALTQVEWEDTTPDSPPSSTRNTTPTSPTPPPKTQKQMTLPVTRVEWDDTPEPTTEDVTIRQKTPRTSVASPQQSPRSTN